MRKKLSIRILCLLLIISLLPVFPALAAESGEDSAARLNSLGLFQGTEKGYELDKTATRAEGLVMLLRLLGEEDAALSCTLRQPFDDMNSHWASPYVAYAYSKGYTDGTSDTTFSPNLKLSFKNYVTFLLRALGYNDAAGDFSYDSCLTESVEFGLMTADSAKAIGSSNPTFFRADMVKLSLAALTLNMKGSSQRMAQKLCDSGVFSTQDGQAAGVLGGESVVYTYTAKTTEQENPAASSSSVTRVSNTYSLPSGSITADVITVDTAAPGVQVKVKLENNTLGSTRDFKQIVADSGAKVVINGNFFESYQDFKIPIGYVVSEGEFLYGVAGLTSLGISTGGELRFGRPSFFFTVTQENGQSWACYECNSPNGQGKDTSVLYTPVYGQSFTMKVDGLVTTVSGGVIQSSHNAAAGEQISIPSNGFVMFFGNGFTSTSYYRAPQIGASVTMNPTPLGDTAATFPADDLACLVTGAPCLVENGEICTKLDAGFSEARFTTASTPRTAVGKLADGKLVIVSVSSATIQQMRELMLQLGCTGAINLDGGASTALAWDGQVVRPAGRQLTVTLQVYGD